MKFPNTFREFIDDYSFKDEEEVYTNGSELIQTFRVMQGYEHFISDHDKQIRDEVIEGFVAELKKKCKKESLMDKDGFFFDVFHFDLHGYEIDEIANQLKGGAECVKLKDKC